MQDQSQLVLKDYCNETEIGLLTFHQAQGMDFGYQRNRIMALSKSQETTRIASNSFLELEKKLTSYTDLIQIKEK